MDKLPSYFRQLFESMLSLDCTTGNEKAMAILLSNVHKEGGYRVQKQKISEDRWNIWAFHPSLERENRILFSSHIDTVPPHLDWKHDAKKDCYFGRGACDTKGGILAQIMAGKELQKTVPIDFLWVVGEETDHIGAIHAKKWYEQKKKAYSYKRVVLCEPTGNRLASAQKGILKGKIIFYGKNVHSGYPHLGIDANKKMIEVAEWMYQFAEEHRDDMYGNFDINVGLLKGGIAANVLSDKAECTFLARSNGFHCLFKKELERRVSQGDLCTWISDNPPRVFDLIEPLKKESTYIANFNTDAVHLSSIAPVYLCGPGDIIHAHSEKEHIFVKHILAGVIFYKELVQRVRG